MTGPLSTLRRAVRGMRSGEGFLAETGYLAGSQYVTAALNLIATTTAARLLSAEAFGAAAVMVALPSLALTLVAVKTVSITLSHIASARARGDDGALRSVVKFGYLTDALAAVGAVVAVLLAVEFGAVAVPSHHRSAVIAYSVSLVPLSLAGTSYAILAGTRRFGRLAVAQVAQGLLALVFIVAALLTDPTETRYVLALAAGQVAAGGFWMVSSQLGRRRFGLGGWWRSRHPEGAKLRRELISQSSWNYVSVGSSGALAQLPVLLLSQSSAEEAGFYRLAFSIAATAGYLESALWRVANARAAALVGTGEVAELRALVRAWTRRHGPLAGAAVLLGAPLAAAAIPTVFGEAYRPMVPGTLLLLVGTAVTTATFHESPVLYGFGRVRSWVVPVTAYVAVTLAIDLWVAPRHGFTGVAAVHSAAVVVFRAAMLHRVDRIVAGA